MASGGSEQINGPTFWAALHLVTLCGIPVKCRSIGSNAPNFIQGELKLLGGRNDHVADIATEIDIPQGKLPLLVTDDDRIRRDEIVQQVFVTELAKPEPTWNLFWAALKMAYENKVPLRVKCELTASPHDWRLGLCIDNQIECDGITDYHYHNRGVHPAADRNVIRLANTLDMDNHLFPLGPDAHTKPMTDLISFAFKSEVEPKSMGGMFILANEVCAPGPERKPKTCQ